MEECYRPGSVVGFSWHIPLHYLFVILALLFTFIATNADAVCVCRCVNGRMMPLCSSITDIPPFCPSPTLCPTADAPTLAPPDSRTIPPAGTRRCFQAQELGWEAMFCGTPVAAIRLGTVPEIVDEGVTGFSASSPEDFLPTIKKALRLDRHRVRLQAQQRFSAEHMAHEYIALYERLISKK